MKKKITILFVFLLAIIVGIYFYFNQDFRNIQNEKSDYCVSARILQHDFDANDSLANEKYLDKIISVKGKVTNLDFDNHSLEIDDKVLVVFKDSIAMKLALKQEINIKGRFIGYDDLFQQFRLDEVVLEK